MNVQQLRALPGWQKVGEAEGTALVQAGSDRWIRAGQAAVEAGKLCVGPLLIASGEVQVLFEVADMGLAVVVLGPGDWLAPETAYDSNPPVLGARALSDVRALSLPREQVDRIRNLPQGVAVRLTRTLLQSQAKIAAALGLHAAPWLQKAHDKRQMNRADLVDLGMQRLAQATQAVLPSGAQPASKQVELIGHEGPAIAANFRPIR